MIDLFDMAKPKKPPAERPTPPLGSLPPEAEPESLPANPPSDSDRADLIRHAILTTHEPFAKIAQRLGVTRQRVGQARDALVRNGEDIPARHRGAAKQSLPSSGDGDSTIGKRIAERRIARGLSQRALAELIGIHQPTVNNAEHGGDDVTHEVVVKIAKGLDCDPCDLDPKLAPANVVSLSRFQEDLGTKNRIGGQRVRYGSPRWEPLRPADREKFDAIWDGDGPDSGRIGLLVDRAAADGIAVVFRGDLPVELEGDGGA